MSLTVRLAAGQVPTSREGARCVLSSAEDVVWQAVTEELPSSCSRSSSSVPLRAGLASNAPRRAVFDAPYGSGPIDAPAKPETRAPRN